MPSLLKLILLFILIFSFTKNFVLSQNDKYFLTIHHSDSIAAINIKERTYKLKDSISVQTKLQNIIDKWKQADYWLANIDSTIYDGKNIKAYLYLGTKFQNNSILLDSINPSLLNLLDSRGNFHRRGKLSFKDFTQIRENIIEHYENTGYPFVQVSIDSLVIENKSFCGLLKIDKNNFISIDSVLYKGKPKLSTKYLNHYVSIHKGDAYNQSKIDEIDENLDKLPYVSLHRATEIEFRENKADIYLYLQSKRSNYFNGMLGFVSSANNDKGLNINGDINLSLCNNLKIAETLDIQWNKFGTASQKLNLITKFPYIFILPIGVDFGFSLEKQELDYLNTELSASLSYKFSFQNEIKAYYRKKQTFLINNDIKSLNLQSSKNYTIGIRFIYDATDYILNPSKGLYINAASGFGYRSVDSIKTEIIDFELACTYFLRLGSIYTIALQNKSAAMYGSNYYYSNELYRIGGSKILRGFDQASIYASAYTVFSIEPRLLISKNSAVYLFMDYAWYESRLESSNIFDTPFSFGLGMNVNTKAGIFKIAYAIGKQFNNPIKFSDSKVHFGFAARF